MSKPYIWTDENSVLEITDPNIGRHWWNLIFNKNGYAAIFSHVGHGYSWTINEKGNQALLNKADGRCLYLRDEKSGRCWSPAFAPLMEPVEDYRCEHGMAFSRISSRKDGIATEWEMTVPDGGECELWRVTVKNESEETRELSVFPLIKFDLGGFTQPAYYSPETTSYAQCDDELQGILCQSQNPYNPHGRYSGFMAAREKPFAMDADLNSFCGAIASFARPQTLLNGGDCKNTNVALRGRGAVIQSKISLQPGESTVLVYSAGMTANLESARAEAKAAFAVADEWSSKAAAYGKNRFGTLRTKTPEKRIDQIMNFWAQKQVSFCAVGKKAVRDNAQIAMGILNFDAKLGAETMAECFEHQYADGHAALTWSPYLDQKLYSDPAMWLILATCEVVKETGDRTFLDRIVPFQDEGEATIYEHMKRGAEWLLASKGPHGLPLIHYADWCDALNIPNKGAESVFMAMAFCWALKEMANLAEWVGDAAYAADLMARRETLVKTTNDVAWNGDYYIRAFNGDEKIGDKDSPVGGTIYANPQSWSILGDVCPPEKQAAVFAALDSMDTDVGIPLCKPAYSQYYPSVGRMSGMAPGVYENGGIYNHAVGFKIMADCKAGRSENALRSLLKMIPDDEKNPVSHSQTDPHVFTNCWIQHEYFKNKVGFSWMTGTSAWGLRGFYEGICGLRRCYDGLKIDPNIPSGWNELSVQRPFRGCIYQIEYRRAAVKQTEVRVDGVLKDNSIITENKTGQTIKIEVLFQ